MNLNEIEDVLKLVRYPHFEIYAGGETGRFYIQARFPGGPPGGLQHTRKWYISQHACKNEVVQTALKMVLTAVEHEAREMFTYKGRKIFGPHYDVDFLAEMCGHRRNLDYRSKP